jgi:hypothetical protein
VAAGGSGGQAVQAAIHLIEEASQPQLPAMCCDSRVIDG